MARELRITGLMVESDFLHHMFLAGMQPLWDNIKLSEEKMTLNYPNHCLLSTLRYSMHDDIYTGVW